MTSAATQFARPRTVAEAVKLLATHGPAALIIAGGTDVVPNLQMRLFTPRILVDIKAIAEMSGVTRNADGSLRIGALTTLTSLLNTELIRDLYPVLHAAVATVAGPLQRNMGTVGGNLCLDTRCRWYNQSWFWRKSLGFCLKKDGDICHVAPGGKFCWAAWSGDSAPALLTLDAEVEIAGVNGNRRIPLAALYTGDGMNRLSLAPGELLTAVHVPASSAGRRGTYLKLRIRNAIDYPLAGVAVSLHLDPQGVCRAAKVALCAVNPAPKLIPEASDWLVGQKFSPELVERVAHQAIRTGKPLTTSASTPEYRRDMLRVFTRRALEQSWQSSNGK